MEYIYEIAAFLVLTFIIFVVIKKYNTKKENQRILAELKSKARRKVVKSSAKVVDNNLALGEVKNSGGIISKKIVTSPPKEKIAKWVDTNSYEDDVRQKQNIVPVAIIQENEEEMKKIIIRSLILLVDDSLVVRKYVGDLLKKHNYDLVIKTDGWEAITYLNGNSQKPDLIITDIQMPNMDGFQLIEAIRKEKKFSRVPIIVISAHVEAHDHLILMEEENIQGFIRKPFEDADLTVQTKYLLDNY
jgi:two-component system, chemotaxis family, chemotaxis protein CheY